MGKPAVAIDLTSEERRALADLAGRRRTAQGLARRARIVLLAAEGLENQDICAELDVDAAAVLFIGTIQGLVMQSLLAGKVSRIRRDAPAVFAIYRRGIESGT